MNSSPSELACVETVASADAVSRPSALQSYGYLTIVMIFLTMAHLAGRGKTDALSVMGWAYIFSWGGAPTGKLSSERYVLLMVLILVADAMYLNLFQHNASSINFLLLLACALYMFFVFCGSRYLTRLHSELVGYYPASGDEEAKVRSALKSAYAFNYAVAVTCIWPVLYLMLVNDCVEHGLY